MARNQISHHCLVPGCLGGGRNQIGVRCRVAHSGATPFADKGRTYSMFSIESDAYLCDTHALQGVSLALAVTPDRSQEASLAVVCGAEMTSLRSTAIAQPDDEPFSETA